ncbi:nuclear transport factor 2 family protein [Rhodococcus sp. HNM0569]|uniref:nuclear transport factor 2 family protein n=1 Tax=Rhodococcus sp. HNM0569 TaxID=2716340 RepID=UPI00146E611D|nr:nuclear transport factor 2 family protein [Rhodococcus sp. HNM0569]NLU84283.1 nuclear transport factor 2 family protein [Rhodococcus sp. HNM0569]
MAPSDDAAAVHDAGVAFERAIVANDPDAIAASVTPDWAIVDGDGIGTVAAFLDLVESGQLTHSAMNTVAGTERIRVYGDTAVRSARVTNTAQFDDETFGADEWTTDVYVRTADGWRCMLSHTTPVEE